MNAVKLAIQRPVAVSAMVLMVIMLGLVAYRSIPIQLAPDVQKPVITVTTSWFGAAPAEVEREIINRQEEQLKGLEGVTEMESEAQDGRGQITLEFNIGHDMNRALLLVSNRLDQVTGYPEEVDEPRLDTSGTEDRPIAWFTLRRLPGNARPMHGYGDFVEDVIKPRIERVPGVSRVNIYGGSEREIRVVVNPEKMARYRLTVPESVDTLRAANASVSGGDVDEGKRRYVVRVEGEFERPSQVREVLLRTIEDPETGRVSRITVADIADDVRFDYKKPRAHIRHLGEPAIAFNAVREKGANVIETMKDIRTAVEELKSYEVPRAGLKLEQVYDETVYINSAIDLVKQNIYVGGTFAALVLLLFLRSVRATLVVSLAIPVSIIGSFAAMAALGRSINVISLAGMAFAVGMVVDAAIVVLENIYRLRQEGKGTFEAAYIGARQVWGAVLVSVVTTVVVFAPVIAMQVEVGQLFRDIAVAISVAVVLSLIVAVTVIPTLSRRLLGGSVGESKTRLRLPIIDDVAEMFVRLVVGYARMVARSKVLALGVVAAICGTAALAAWLFLPKLEYLPEGNRNLIFGVIVPPPGYNLETMTEIANRIESSLTPLWATTPEAQKKALEREDGPPGINHFFFVARRGQTFLGAKSVDPSRVRELIPVIEKPAFSEPGTFGFINQPSLFGRASAGTRSLELNVSGPEIDPTLDVARQAAFLVQKALPREEGNQLRPKPGLELGAPEVRLVPDRLRLTDAGVTARELGMTVDAFNDGMRVAEITVGGKRMDLTLQGREDEVRETQGINNLPVVTPSGTIVPADSLAEVELIAGPTEIRHLERERTITLEIRPTNKIPLEQAIEILQDNVIAPLQDEGLPPGVKLRISGTADELTKAWQAMSFDLVLALAIVYLVMAVLFESFLYPFIIMFSVPVAAAGGVAGLAVLNLFRYQALDMLTLLGFVILIGIVVNNAILIVHQTLHHLREEGMEPTESILEATRNRIRPIFMSTITSVCGMFPLVLFPGAGSELYRGLGSVVIGGLSLSAMLTLAIVPSLLSVFVTVKREVAPEAEAPEPVKVAAE